MVLKPASDPRRLDELDELITTPSRPTFVETDDDRRERRLSEELRPLVDSLRRLRDRGLLD